MNKLDKDYLNLVQDILDNSVKKMDRTGTGTLWMLVSIGWPGTQEEFINMCKTDDKFSKTWGLQIEERELTLEERAEWLQNNKGYDLLVGNLDHDHVREVVEEEAPSKLIKVTYKDKTIESYGN
jgi:hypothetical protein